MTDLPISCQPRPRDEAALVIQAAQQLLVAETIRSFGGAPDLVVVGDSLIQNWQWDPAWKRVTEGRKVLNFGLGGDRTEHLLWRLEQGLVDALPAPRAVLLIGINNVWSSPAASEIVPGIAACVQRMKKGMPHTAIAVYRLFPLCGKVDHLNSLVDEINGRLADALASFHVSFRDLGPRLRGDQGRVSQELMPDGCHLTEPAYHLWTDDLIEWLNKPSNR